MPGEIDAESDSGPDPRNPECDTSESGTDSRPLNEEERFGVPKGSGHFFRIDAASGRTFAVWAGSEEMAKAAVERIDRVTIPTGRETFRIAAVPVRRKEGSAEDFEIAKVREIRS